MNSIDDLKAALNTAISRIATLEQERTTKPTGLDPKEVARQLTLNPLGFYATLGLSPDTINHIKTVHIADTLGDQAPLQMRMAANSGPQLIAAQQATATVESLSRRLDEMTAAQTAQVKRAEFDKTISESASKYPHLAKAYKANPDLFRSKVTGGSDVNAVLESEEKTAAAYASALGATAPQGQPASLASVNTAGNISTPSKQVTSAAPVNAEAPKPEKSWNQDKYLALKEKIVAQMSTPKP